MNKTPLKSFGDLGSVDWEIIFQKKLQKLKLRPYFHSCRVRTMKLKLFYDSKNKPCKFFVCGQLRSFCHLQPLKIFCITQILDL